MRKSSEAEHAQELVDDFLNHLHTLLKVIRLMRLFQFYLKKSLQLPPEISNAIRDLEIEVKEMKFSVQTSQKNGMLNFLKKYRNLNVFGFNSSKYDLKCIVGYIYNYCSRNSLKPNILKVYISYNAFITLILERNKVFDAIY